MNEEYLQGFYNSFVKPSRPDVSYNDWVTKVKDNDQYKQGMFNTYVKSAKPDADYNDWNTKIFGQEERSFLGAIPVIGDVIHYGGKALENVVTNQIPQTAATLSIKGHSARQRELEQLLAIPGLSDEQRAALEKDIEHHKTTLPKLANYVAKQADESSKLMSGNVQNLTDINSVSSFMNWLGTSVGQAGGQIPLTIGTGGTSSFLMEAAEVYDNQLDLLAEKHGITKEQVVEQGLDKPAEGEAYAILAGALDVVSASKITGLFKNIAKQGAKNLGKETVKKSIIKEALKDGAFEALTEGTQGQLEKAGGAAGAGTEYHFDPKQFLNEAAAGAVGGMGLGMASQGASNVLTKKQPHPAAQTIQDHEDVINSLSTGDPELDLSIDQLQESTTKEINDLFDKAAEITGLKTQEELTEIKKQRAELAAEKAKVDQEAFMKQMYESFQQAPTVLQQHPASEENEYGPQVDELSPNKIDQPQFTTQATTIPKYDPTTLDEVGTQPAETFSMKLPQGEATGTIAGGVASLNEIYANKDTEGNPVKGGNLYGNLIDNLRNKQISKLRVGAQSPASAAILQKLVDKGELQIDPKGDVIFGDKTIHTQFNIQSKPNDSQNIQGVQSEVGKRQEPIQPQPVKSTSSEASATSRVFQAPQERGLTQQEEQLKNSEIKLQTQLENALKRKPSMRVAAIERVIEKADKLGLTTIRDKAVKLSDKEIEAQNVVAEEKEVRKKQRTPKMTKEERATYLAEQKGSKKKALEEKAKTSKMLKPVEGSNINVKQGKEAFLKEIAYLRETGDKNYRAVAEKYLAFRKAQGLKEINLEKALTEAKAEHYVEQAKKRTEKERGNKRLVSNRVATMKKEGKSASEIAKVESELKESLRLDLEKRLGFKLDTLEGINLNKLFNDAQFRLNLTQVAGESLGEAKANKLRTASTEELISSLEKTPDFRSEITVELLKTVDKLLAKRGIKLNILIYNTNKTIGGGMYATAKKNHVLLLAGKFDKNGILTNLENQTIMHEILHGYTGLLSQVAYGTNETFSRQVNKIYDNGKAKLRSVLSELANKKSKELTTEQVEIFNATVEYINSFYGKPYANELLNNKDSLLDSVYGFTSANEMLSELSSPEFARLLNAIPSGEKVMGKPTSMLAKFFEALRQMVKSFKAFDGPSIFDNIEEVVNEFAGKMNENTVFRKTLNPYFHVPTLKDLAYEHPEMSPKQIIKMREQIAARLEKEESIEEFKKATAKSLNLNEKIIDKIAKTLENRTEIKTLNDVKAYYKGINTRMPASRQLADAYADITFSKIESLRRKRAINKTTFKVVVDRAKANPKYKTSWKFKKDVDDFASVDTNAVPADKFNLLNQSIDSLSRDQFVSEEGYNIMINFGKKLTKLKALVKVAPKMDQHIAYLTTVASNPASLASIIARYDKHTSTEILNHIYGGTMEAFANVTREAHDFVTNLSKIAENGNLTHSNLARIGIYGSIFSTKNDPRNKVEWENEIRDNARHALESAINKQSGKEQSNYKGDLTEKEIKREIEIAKELHDSIVKNPDLVNILTKEEQAFYDSVREFSKKHERDFERNTIGTWGNENYENRFNYFPTLAQGKVSGLLSGDQDPLIRDNKDNLMEALALHDNKTSENTVYGKKVWSQYKRLNPKGYFYNFDALSIAERWSKNMLYDMYATTELKALNRLLRDQKFQKAVNIKTRDAFKMQLRSIAGVGNKYDPNAVKGITTLMSVRDKLYTATLASSGQIFSQSSSGFAAAAVISSMAGLKAPKIFAQAVNATFKSSFGSEASKLQQFLKKEGLGIQLRDVLFEKYLTSDSYKSYLKSKGQKALNSAQNMTEWGLRQGDKLGARIVWFAAYFNAGGTLENPNKEAILEAERQVGILQNMSDLNFSAPMFKYDNAWKKLVFGMFYAYKSFAVNSYVNILYSSRNSLRSSEARQVLAAQLASVLAYHAAAAAIVKPLYEAIGEAIFGGGDDDDDKEKRYSKVTQIIAESAWDTGALTPMFGMAAPAGVDALSRWLFAKTLAPKIFGNELPPLEEFDQYLDNPIYAKSKGEDAWKEFFGPGYKDAIELAIATGNLAIMQTQTDEFFETMEEGEKREQKIKEWEMQALTLVMAANPMVPLRGDFKKLIQAQLRKEKAQYLKENKAGKGARNSVGTEGETPQFEEKDYELINQ